MAEQNTAVHWSREDEIGILTLDRPESMNAITLESRQELCDVLGQIGREKDLRAVIITGAGKAFSAGGDLETLASRAREFRARGGARELFSNHMARALLDLEMPLIAAINGPAVGAGLAITLACDLRIAVHGARFGAVSTRVGLSPEYATSFLLPRIVGLTKASELVLTARLFDAPEALAMGLIGEIVEADELMTRARALAHQITALPLVAVRMAKQSLRYGLDCTLTQALSYEELAESYCLTSDDHVEAIDAFLHKRKPSFTDR